MATFNNVRLGNTAQKKTRSLMAVRFDASTYKDYAAAGANTYLVGKLPPDAVVTNTFLFTDTVSSTATLTAGTAPSGTQLMTLGVPSTLGKTGTSAAALSTGTGADVYINLPGAVTTGVFTLHIEYSEPRLNEGSYTPM